MQWSQGTWWDAYHAATCSSKPHYLVFSQLQIGDCLSSLLSCLYWPIFQREKVRQRPPIESRLRDERGNRRFDRNDSPTHDGSSDNPDDAYDSYGDPVMHGAFPPDIPAPPVLMPVPGAG